MAYISLRTKISIASSMTALIILGTVIAFFVVAIRDKAISTAKTEYLEKTRRLSFQLKGAIDNSFSRLQAQNNILKSLDSNNVLSKSTTLEIIKSNLLKNPDYVGMRAIFEPNTFCSSDNSYPQLMDKGMFIPFLYYNSKGGVNIEPSINYKEKNYYFIPKRTNEPLLSEPYRYSINGKDVSMVTLSEPILNNDNFIGITSIDYDISFIQDLSKDMVLELNNGNSSVVVASSMGGIIACSADSSLIGHNINKLYAEGIEFNFAEIKGKTENIELQNGDLVLDIPVIFSETKTTWRVHAVVPMDDILSETNKQILKLIIIGILLLLVSFVIINKLTGKLTLPLLKLVESTEKIKDGDLSVVIKTKQNDEIGILSNSFNVMLNRLREMIKMLKESINQVEIKNIKLADEEAKFRKLFEEAPDAIILLYGNADMFDCNKSATELFKLSKDDLLGKTFIDVSPAYQPDNRQSSEKLLELLDETLKNNPQRFEWEHTDGEGKIFTVSISLNKIELSGITYVQAILRDITEKKQKDKELEMHRNHLEVLVSEKTNDLEIAYKELQTTLQYLQDTQAQLLQSEKMASLGILTAGVAHEINDPLNFIMGAYIGLLRHYNDNSFTENHEQVGLLINTLKTGLDRSSTIIKGMIQFSRKSDSLEEDCDIHSIINNSLTMLHNQIRHDITVEKDFFASDIVIKGNVGNLHQVFINVLGNAVRAMVSKGTISIKTESKQSDVVIKITDTGTGISPENLKKITDPFFTTKNPEKGTDLELSITYNIIKEHKGKIEFESIEGLGTSVKIILPKTKIQ